jgi:lipopolysaccharide export system protein LptC
MNYRTINLRRKYIPSLKILCLGAMLGLIVTFYILQNNTAATNSKVNFSVVTTSDGTPNVLSTILNPKLMSMDKKNQPFTVIAEKATQSNKDKTVLLEKVSGEIVMTNSRWVYVSSDNGKLENEKLLDLFGTVHLYTNDGYEVNTAEAHVDINSGTVHGDKEVEVTGFRGKIRGNGFDITEQGNLIKFAGPVNVTLYPKN